MIARRCFLALFASLASICWTGAHAQEAGQPEAGGPPETTAAAPADERAPALLSAIDAYGQAYNQGDAAAVAAHWAIDGVHVDRATGEETRGREAIERAYAEAFAASPGATIAIDVHQVRFITDDVAQVQAVVALAHPPAGDEEESATSETELSATYKRVDGAWLLDNVQEVVLPETPTPRDHLAVLEWLAGEWQDDAEGAVIRSSFKWSAKQAFFIRSFHVQREGQVLREGTQIFGWDPEQERIRTWIFGSEGGFGEGTCEASDGELLVKMTGVLSDGRRAAATQKFTRNEDGSVTSELLGSEIDGQLQPNTPPVRMLPAGE